MLQQAIIQLRGALNANPNRVDLRHQLGQALAQAGDQAGAITAYRHALRLQPDFVPARLDLANLLLLTGRPREAETTIRVALRQAPQHPRAHNILGLTLAATNLPEALAAFEIAVRHAAQFYLEAESNRAAALGQLGRAAEAESVWRHILAHAPADVLALTALHHLLNEAGRLAEDEPILRQLLALTPQDAALHFALGDICARTARREAALACFTAAISLAPGNAQFHYAKGVVLYDMGRFADSLPYVERAAALAPGNPEMETSRSFAYLLRGDYAGGWRLFEFRNEKPGNVRLPAPRWDGSPTARTVLIYGEQGIGDSLQFCRFLAAAAARAKIIFAGPAACRRLFEGFTFLYNLCTEDPLPAHDLQCPLMSLPYVLGVQEADFASAIPYLRADPAAVERWRTRLAPLPGLRAGVVWAGNPQFPADALRSIPFDIFARLFDIPGISFISLQKNNPGGISNAPLTDVAEQLTDFAATAACICALDLVITVDTAVAHLAGALARPVWLLNRAGTDWRWGMHGSTTPWYPSMRIFRQSAAGDWAGVIQAVRAAVSGVGGFGSL